MVFGFAGAYLWSPRRPRGSICGRHYPLAAASIATSAGGFCAIHQATNLLYATYANSYMLKVFSCGKVILILHDGDNEEMLRLKERGDDPTKYLQQAYRKFKLQLQ